MRTTCTPPHLSFATPLKVETLEECAFYHTFDLPGIGTVPGEWDLRQTVSAYLGKVNFNGRRVLDVGTADGFLCFYAEQQGASEVVALDLSPEHDWDIVPFAQMDTQAELQKRRKGIQKLNNAFWLAHRLLNSRAKLIYSDAYSFRWPSQDFEVVIFGAILLHLRDPFLALQRILESAKDTVIVAELLWPRQMLMYLASGLFRQPLVCFLPDPVKMQPNETWWAITPAAVRRWLAVLGFNRQHVTIHRQRYRKRWQWMYTVVARR